MRRCGRGTLLLWALNPPRLPSFVARSAKDKIVRETKRLLIKAGVMQPYQPEFFDGFSEISARSAGVVLPILLELVKGPSAQPSLVDVGCGQGHWLSQALRLGLSDVVGIDGAYVDAAGLAIPKDRFVVRDLASPIGLDRRFDLAMSVEVAEHLLPARAEGFVTDLCKLAPVVMFSAACPGQGGTGHQNEQWPSYWSELFAKQGYVGIDALRPKIWADERVAWWYRQNLIVFVRRSELSSYPRLDEVARFQPPGSPLNQVHPDLHARLMKRAGVRR